AITALREACLTCRCILYGNTKGKENRGERALPPREAPFRPGTENAEACGLMLLLALLLRQDRVRHFGGFGRFLVPDHLSDSQDGNDEYDVDGPDEPVGSRLPPEEKVRDETGVPHAFLEGTANPRVRGDQ